MKLSDQFFDAQICQNGHVASFDTDPDLSLCFCDKCSSPMITSCLSCHTKIRGCIKNRDVKQIFYRPAYCYACGEPFPWTKSTLDATRETILEDEDLFDDEKEKICKSLPDLISETPRTNLAVTRVKKAVLRAGPDVKDALKQFVISLACEAAKMSLGM